MVMAIVVWRAWGRRRRGWLPGRKSEAPPAERRWGLLENEVSFAASLAPTSSDAGVRRTARTPALDVLCLYFFPPVWMTTLPLPSGWPKLLPDALS
jgi:hypothetical protein